MQQDEPIFLPKGVLFRSFWTQFCVESVSSRRGVYFRSRRENSSRIRREEEFMTHRGAMRNYCRQLAPILRQSLARSFGRNLGSNFTSRDFPQNRRSVPLEIVSWFSCICLYRFLQRRASIEVSASSFLRFYENSFCRKPTRAEILRRVLLWC